MTASDMARKRWAGTSPEARSAHMKAIARKPRPNAKGKKKRSKSQQPSFAPSK